jgi:glycosyltransferase involved in cell wall biosynthesis
MTSSSSVLTVVVPCYNYEGFVAAAIESVLDNTRVPEEIIVVDDGSTDCSAQVAATYPGVTVVRKTNGGMASALNAGFAASHGDVVVLLDADDLAGPDRLSWIEEAFADPDVCMAWHPMVMVDADGKAKRFLVPSEPLPSGDLVPGIVRDGFGSFALTSGIAVRRSALERVGPIPEDQFRSTAEAFLIRTLPFIGRVAATSEPLGTYRSHTGSYMRALSNLDTTTIADRLRRQLDVSDVEHRLLCASAVQTGHALSPARIRASDSTYLTFHRWWSRVSTSSRRDAARTMFDLEVESTPGSPWAWVRRGARTAWTIAMPKRAAVVAFVITNDFQLHGLLRFTARVYWVGKSLTHRLRRSLLIPASTQVRNRLSFSSARSSA